MAFVVLLAFGDLRYPVAVVLCLLSSSVELLTTYMGWF